MSNCRNEHVSISVVNSTVYTTGKKTTTLYTHRVVKLLKACELIGAINML